MNSTLAWIAFLDVFGFSALVLADHDVDPQVYHQLTKAHAAVAEEFKNSSSPARTIIFSDSMFLIYPLSSAVDSHESLRRCVDDICRTTDLFAAYKLTVRGGVAYGRVTMGDNLLIGEPVIRAVEYEKLGIAPVVILPQSELARAAYGGTDIKLTSQLIPVKRGGLLKGCVIKPYNQGAYLSLINDMLEKTSVEGPYATARALRLADRLLRGTNRGDNDP